MTQRTQKDGLSELTGLMRRAETHEVRGPKLVDPSSRRRRRRRGAIATVIVVVVVLALVGGYVFAALTAPVGAAAATVHRPDVPPHVAAAVAVSPEGESAISVAGADDYLGQTASGILAAGGGNAAVPIASISKLITAMVVLDHKPLGSSGTGPTITFDKTAHALYDKYYVLNATITAMPTGSSMSEHDALETMLVVSACNYAEAVSTWAFGSQAAFLSATKTWLTAHGMTGTRMVEPTGIDVRNVGTPSDLIALGKLAIANPAVAAMVATTTLKVPGLEGQRNTNDLLGSDGITGIKTGTLDPAGSDLLFSAVVPVGTPQPLTIIGVVLGGSTHESVDLDVQAMIASLQAGFHNVDVGAAGQVVGHYSTPWGGAADMVLVDSASVFTWSNTPITSTMTTATLKTGKTGEKVGSITWTAGKNTITVPIVLKGSIKPPTTKWRLTHPKQLLSWWP